MSWVNVDTYELPAGSVWAGMPAYEGDFNLKWNLESYEWGLFSGGEQKYLYDPEWEKWHRVWSDDTVEVQRWEETPDFQADPYSDENMERTWEWMGATWMGDPGDKNFNLGAGLKAVVGNVGQNVQDFFGVDFGDWWATIMKWGPLILLGLLALAFIWFTKGRK